VKEVGVNPPKGKRGPNTPKSFFQGPARPFENGNLRQKTNNSGGKKNGVARDDEFQTKHKLNDDRLFARERFGENKEEGV